MLFTQACGQTQNGRPFDWRRTNLALRKSLSTFLHEAVASTAVSSLRKIPSLKAFRNSKTCNGVKAKVVPLPIKYAFTCDVFASAM